VESRGGGAAGMAQPQEGEPHEATPTLDGVMAVSERAIACLSLLCVYVLMCVCVCMYLCVYICVCIRVSVRVSVRCPYVGVRVCGGTRGSHGRIESSRGVHGRSLS
jgi:hypothetical protein